MDSSRGFFFDRQGYLDSDRDEDQFDENSEGEEDGETLPDEEYRKISKNRTKVKNSWPNNNNSGADPRNIQYMKFPIVDKLNGENPSDNPGPNINLKLPRKSYGSHEEKKYFYNKIKTKKKTELCKNWALYNDCFFRNNCSFAHGDRELRQALATTDKYKTKSCKMFQDNFYCNYGNSARRMFKYSYLLEKFSEEFNLEVAKKENEKKELWKVLQLVKCKKQYNFPRLKIFNSICKSSNIEPN